MNGQQRSEQNLATFLSWVVSKTDDDFREMVMRGQLSRQEIARECGFAKSVLLQNPRVKEALKTLEAQLRERQVLPSLADASEGGAAPQAPPNPRTAADKARLKRLESENASLRAELAQLRASLDRYRLMDNVLCSTGRLPR
ncbi:MAG: VPA1267 family protein [Georgfuchsia sp.]